MNIKLQVNRQENADQFGVNIGDIVNIDFEQFLVGVVASEIGNSNLEACKAQAVAARTYALSRNIAIGNTISDSANIVAFRANRIDKNKYPNTYQAVNETKGQILTYNNEIARTVYSANNGGETTSSEERWGSYFPYLIKQKDPWDAADGNSKKGHGVGLSQKGAIWAGAHGVDYKEILSFYYPNTILKNNYGQEEKSMNVLLNDTAKKIVELAHNCLGYPYVYTGAGQTCTPANRKKKVNSLYPNIVNKCQVLSQKKSDCTGCKYQGQRFFDCRGFTYWIFNQFNVNISAVGATTQYNTASSWIKRGKIEDMPNVVCSVFKYNASAKNMKHTGLHIGNGVIIHCTDVKAGEVQYDAISNTTWTHFGVPKDLYTESQLAQAEKITIIQGLKKGSTGTNVIELQEKLNQLGYTCDVDGRYGDNTANAVKEFQRKYNLTVDGIAGAITRTLILELTNNKVAVNNSSETSTIEEPVITITPIINSNKVSLTLEKNLAEALYAALKKVL